MPMGQTKAAASGPEAAEGVIGKLRRKIAGLLFELHLLSGIEQKTKDHPYNQQQIGFFAEMHAGKTGDGNQLQNDKGGREADAGYGHGF